MIDIIYAGLACAAFFAALLWITFYSAEKTCKVPDMVKIDFTKCSEDELYEFLENLGNLRLPVGCELIKEIFKRLRKVGLANQKR